jgi:hypothetical protein
MWRPLRANLIVLWTVILAVLAVRASDTHLHFCFDGQEPPATLHFADASVHHDEAHDEGASHADQDVDPFIGAVVKSDDDPQPIFALIVGALLTIDLLLPADDTPSSEHYWLPTAGSAFYLRPPLRGPPA